MFKKSVATRENVKLKIGLAGPSGAGKTYSALQLAYGITGDWGKIAVGDTENKSALYYAGLGPWQHIPFDPEDLDGEYHPDNWVKLIEFAEKDPTIEVLILDSISHEWEGKGGCLQIQERLGGRYQDWAKVTPMHTAFIDALRLSRLHIIATMRSKQDYAMEKNDKGRTEVTKVGMKTVQREGADYEFGIVFDVSMNHYVKTGKDRTGLFAPRGPFQITPAIGKELVAWASSGVEPPAEAYNETNAQKIAFKSKCVLAGITDPKKMATVSGVCVGLEMNQLDAAIREWLEGEAQAGKARA